MGTTLLRYLQRLVVVSKSAHQLAFALLTISFIVHEIRKELKTVNRSNPYGWLRRNAPRPEKGGVGKTQRTLGTTKPRKKDQAPG